MKLEKIIIENFRSYKSETIIDVADLTVFVGRNDIGKSTVLEAMDIFFNEKDGIITLDKEDINKAALSEGNNEVKIGAIFSDLPVSLTIDATNPTTLSSEFLLNENGMLEIVKRYPNAGREKVFINALHPTNENCLDLHAKKISDLKKLLKPEIACEDKTKCSLIRKAIWGEYSADLKLNKTEIEIAKIDEKSIWDQIKKLMPLYALFQSDRKNSDGDSEIQDPMKLAVQEILKDEALANSLNEVAKKVEEKLSSVASKTLEKLREMNPEIANNLSPIMPATTSLKWADVFKSVSISSDDQISINKRGSGVKRLVLLNFFRAEVERRQIENGSVNIIYAIEEPETSQHPKYQEKLIKAFIDLSCTPSVQILMTTHSPAIVKMLDFKHITMIKAGGSKIIEKIKENELPYPSLNEVNFMSFNEASEEYHNELYGYIESEARHTDFIKGKALYPYNEVRKGVITPKQKCKSEIIRHQIHHPENTANARFTEKELYDSIDEMRAFIKNNIKNQV